MSKTFGDPDPVFTYTASGFWGTDNNTLLSGSLTRASGEAVGFYSTTQGALVETSGNYIINFAGAQFEIKIKEITDEDPDLVIANIVSQLYKGDYITPEPAVRYKGVTLTKGVDYDLSYSDNRNVGTAAMVIITFKGNYSGTAHKTFAITPATLTIRANSGQFKIFGSSDPALTYTPSGFVGTDTATLLTGSLTRQAGETVRSYNILIGTLSAGDNYTISFVGESFEIRKQGITGTDPKLNISGINPSYEYTGSDIKPVPVVIYNGVTLVAGTDYDVDYDQNKNVGTEAKVIITFKNSYDGTVEKTFAITPAKLTVTARSGLSKIFGTGDPELTYTATGWKVPSDDETLLDGFLARDPGEAVGFYNILIGSLVETSGNYTISFTGAQFEIRAREITGADPDLEISGINSPYVYTGYAITPVLTVKYKGETLVPGRDYDLGYAHNKNVGTNATVTITFKGGYSGTVDKQFEITPATLTVTADHKTKTYDPTPLDDPKLTYTVSGFLGTDNSDLLKGTLTRAPGETVGLYDILKNDLSVGENYTIVFIGEDKFEIMAAEITDTNPNLEITGIGSRKYTGSDITLDLLVKYHGAKMTKN